MFDRRHNHSSLAPFVECGSSYWLYGLKFAHPAPPAPLMYVSKQICNQLLLLVHFTTGSDFVDHEMCLSLPRAAWLRMERLVAPCWPWYKQAINIEKGDSPTYPYPSSWGHMHPLYVARAIRISHTACKYYDVRHEILIFTRQCWCIIYSRYVFLIFIKNVL